LCFLRTGKSPPSEERLIALYLREQRERRRKGKESEKGKTKVELNEGGPKQKPHATHTHIP